MSEQPKESGLDRRALLGAVGAVAAGSMALEAAFGEGPAAKVEDRHSSVRITALKTTPVGPKAYIKIETNHEITGWGEVTGLEPRVSCVLAQSLFELLDDQNPTRIEHLWQKLYRSHRDMRGGPFMVHTLDTSRGPLWFRKMDRNGDGDVSSTEFLGTPEQFRRLDADGDGLIDVAEAERADQEMRKRP